MTDVSTWLPHATWEGFAPARDGSLAALPQKRVHEVIDALAFLPVGPLRLSGIELGDERALLSLFQYGVRAGIDVEILLARPIDHDKLDAIATSGVTVVSVPVEGPDAATHDAYRQATGEFEQIQFFLECARTLGLRAEARTTLREELEPQLPAMFQVLESLSASRWLVEAPLSDEVWDPLVERTFAALAGQVACGSLTVVSRYAPFFPRLCAEKRPPKPCAAQTERNGICIGPSGVITPDPSIPLPVGDVGTDRLADVFDDHPLLRALRDPDAVEGKCGRCEFRATCGGSRARAWARSGNVFASDPACSYEAS